MKKILFVLLSAAMVMVGCKPAKTYTVTFDMQGHGDQVPSQTVNEGGKVVKPADPTAADFSFSGWYKDTEWKNAWDFDKDIVKSDITLFAKWVGGSVETKTVGWVLNTVDNFPTDQGTGWTKNDNSGASCYKDGGKLWFTSPNSGCEVPLEESVKFADGNYVFEGNGFTVNFIEANGVLVKIVLNPGPQGLVGEYGPSAADETDDPVATADEVDVVDPNPDYNAL